MTDWKDDLFNKNDYNWTDKEFKGWKEHARKEIPYIVGGRKSFNESVKRISDFMYAHRMDKLKLLKLNPIEQQRRSNILWREHLKRALNKRR